MKWLWWDNNTNTNHCIIDNYNNMLIVKINQIMFKVVYYLLFW